MHLTFFVFHVLTFGLLSRQVAVALGDHYIYKVYINVKGKNPCHIFGTIQVHKRTKNIRRGQNRVI